MMNQSILHLNDCMQQRCPVELDHVTVKAPQLDIFN